MPEDLEMTPGRCPCGRPPAVRTWESDLYLCATHARAWLKSPEKIEAVEAIAKDDPLGAELAVQRFRKRIRSEAPLGLRVVNGLRRYFLGE